MLIKLNYIFDSLYMCVYVTHRIIYFNLNLVNYSTLEKTLEVFESKLQTIGSAVDSLVQLSKSKQPQSNKTQFTPVSNNVHTPVVTVGNTFKSDLVKKSAEKSKETGIFLIMRMKLHIL